MIFWSLVYIQNYYVLFFFSLFLSCDFSTQCHKDLLMYLGEIFRSYLGIISLEFFWFRWRSDEMWNFYVRFYIFLNRFFPDFGLIYLENELLDLTKSCRNFFTVGVWANWKDIRLWRGGVESQTAVHFSIFTSARWRRGRSVLFFKLRTWSRCKKNVSKMNR